MLGADIVPDDKGGPVRKQDEFCEICSRIEWGPGKKRRKQKSYQMGTVKSIESKVHCPRCRFLCRCLKNGATAADSHSALSTTPEQPTYRDDYHLIISDVDDRGDKQLSFTITAKEEAEFQVEVGIMPETYGSSLHPHFVDVPMAKAWLESCENHVACEHLRLQRDQDPDFYELYLTFIDVKTRLLVRPRCRVQYVALSYVWGQGPHDYTEFRDLPQSASSENDFTLLERQPVALTESRLPRTLADAISFTESLGKRYVWIDALCIPQDDQEERLTQIDSMDLIYRNSACTLIALEGDSSAAGLPGASPDSPRNVLRNAECLNPGQTTRWCEELENFPAALSKSHWASRAWTFQEGLLSTRKLVFSSKQVYFVCPSATSSEATSSMAKPPVMWNRILDSIEHSALNGPAIPKSPQEDQLGELVAEYTRRNLGHAEDCLSAFKGVLSTMERTQDAHFFSGLPLADFGRWLLWSEIPKKPPAPGVPSFALPANWHRVGWPSWTWVGHWAPVHYYTFSREANGIALRRLVRPIAVSAATFAIRTSAGARVPLQDYVRGLHARAGRRGISHTHLGEIRLQVSALAVTTVGKDWSWRAHVVFGTAHDDSAFTHARWHAHSTFDDIHFGRPLPKELRRGQLFLLATSAEALEPTHPMALLKNKKPLTERDMQLVLLVVVLNEGVAERVGVARMRVDQFLEKAEWRQFEFDGPIPPEDVTESAGTNVISSTTA